MQCHVATHDMRGASNGMTAQALAAQLSVHPSQTERFIKIAAHDHHEICEVPARRRDR